MVYDVLFAQDEQLRIQPQMVDKYQVSADKLTWTFTLRDGLEWHDGQPVTSEDCIASIKRWASRDPLGQQLIASMGDLKAVDAKTFTLTLKEPFGLVLEALGKPSSNVPFMMPKRVADTDPNKQFDDYTGSGPFIFKKDEWKPGEKVVYVKNTKYKPRAEPPSMLAGGKVVKIDRVEWIAVTDPLTAVNALTQGEIDLIEVAVPDLFPVMKADKNIALYGWNALGSQIIMRFNHLHPPFDNVKARQAAMYAVAQEDFLRAQVGDPEIYRVCNSPLVCGSPYEKSYGNLLIKPDLDKARQLLKESGYDGKPIVMMQATDLQSSNQLPPVGKQALEKIGFKVDLQAMDWQTVVSRRAKKEAAGQGRLEHLLHHHRDRRHREPGEQLLHQRRLRQGLVRLAVRSGDGEAARRLRPRDRPGQAEAARPCRVRPRHGPGHLHRARPVQGVRRLPQGPPLGLAARPGAGDVEHHQEVGRLTSSGRRRAISPPA